MLILLNEIMFNLVIFACQRVSESKKFNKSEQSPFLVDRVNITC